MMKKLPFLVLLLMTVEIYAIEPDSLILTVEHVQQPGNTFGDAWSYDFGRSVCIYEHDDNTVILVGVPNAPSGGEAYSFNSKPGEQWQLLETYTPDSTGGKFGYSVFYDGSNMIFGAPLGCFKISACYISPGDIGSNYFRFFKESKNSLECSSSHFGYSVCTDNGLAIIGTPNIEVSADPGDVFLYRKEVAWTDNQGFEHYNWVPETNPLNSPDVDNGSKYGFSVSLSGSFAVVGAPENDTSGSKRGSAHFFKINKGWKSSPSTWTEEVIVSENVSDEAFFGSSVAIDGEHAIIGAPYDNYTGSTLPQGSAIIFEYNGSRWQETQKLTPEIPSQDVWFGSKVAICGDIAAVSAPPSDKFQTGATYLFQRTDSAWEQIVRIPKCGNSISLSPNYVALGFKGKEGPAQLLNPPNQLGQITIYTLPTLALSRNSLNFDSATDTASFKIENAFIGTLDWKIESSKDWLTVSTNSGEFQAGQSKEISVRIDRTDLDPNPAPYIGQLYITTNSNDDTVTVTVDVPGLVVSPKSLDFDSTKILDSFVISNTGSGTLAWQARADRDWILLSKESGSITTDDDQVDVTVDRTSPLLPAGSHSGTIEITAGSDTAAISIKLDKWAKLSASPRRLDFGPIQNELELKVTNSSQGAVSWKLSTDNDWITMNPKGGTTHTDEEDIVYVQVSRDTLEPKHYSGIITLTPDVGSTIDISIEMDVAGFSVTPDILNFGSTESSLNINISNTGAGTLNWSIAKDRTWINLSDKEGRVSSQSGAVAVTVSIDRENMPTGPCSGNLIIITDASHTKTVQILADMPKLTSSHNILNFPPDKTLDYIEIKNTGAGTLNWKVKPNDLWISSVPNAGNAEAGQSKQVKITIDRSNLEPRSYEGSISLTSNGGDETVKVLVDVSSLYISPAELLFDCGEMKKSFNIENKGSGTIAWLITKNQPWINTAPESGSTSSVPTAISVIVDDNMLGSGEYSDTLHITSDSLMVSLQVTVNVCGLVLTPSELDFGPNISSKSLSITNSGAGNLEWNIELDQPWLSVDPQSGSTTSQRFTTISVNRANMIPGVYDGHVRIQSNGGKDSVAAHMRVLPESFETLVAPTSLKSGTTVNSYQIISVPAILTDPSPPTVLNVLGSHSKKKWRLYDSNNGQTMNIEYPHPDMSNFDPGVGLFLIVKERGKQIKLTDGKYVLDEEFEIQLVKGWNMFGNPYNWDIDKNQIHYKSSPDSVLTIWAYNHGWQDTVQTILPWHGYAIQTENAETLVIRAFEEEQQIAAQNNGNDQDSWSIQLLADNGISKDQCNYLGVKSNAKNGYDTFDHAEPPIIGDYVSLNFPHPEFGEENSSLAYDFRPQNQEHYIWDFNVFSNTPNSTKLTVKGIQNIPQHLELMLTDKVQNKTTNLRDTQTIEFSGADIRFDKRFYLIAAKASHIDELLAINQIPSQFKVYPNYPNPFNGSTVIPFDLPQEAHVSIRIYNVLGELVFSKEQIYAAGKNAVIWNGTSNHGVDVAAGLYIFSIKMGKTRENIKILLSK